VTCEGVSVDQCVEEPFLSGSCGVYESGCRPLCSSLGQGGCTTRANDCFWLLAGGGVSENARCIDIV
jgi:hypothetical protein